MTAARNVTDNSVPVPGDADAGTGLTITADGQTLNGVRGQSIAGVLLAAGHVSWRTTAAGRRPRGIFCGIGVCYDCLATVNGVRDVRVCQRLARDGDVVTTQAERLPGDGR